MVKKILFFVITQRGYDLCTVAAISIHSLEVQQSCINIPSLGPSKWGQVVICSSRVTAEIFWHRRSHYKSFQVVIT